jgi:signal transduction histidine kinase
MDLRNESNRAGRPDHHRLTAVVETLANLHRGGESLAAVAHDARNMLAALSLYCELLEAPGVLNAAYAHYSGELRLVAAASRRLVEKLVALDSRLTAPHPAVSASSAAEPARPEPRWEPPSAPIANLAEELLANLNLLKSLAGPAVSVSLELSGGGWPVRLSSEDLTRILVNLIKNAQEAMPAGGAVQIRLSEQTAGLGLAPLLRLSVEDNGPGLPAGAGEKIFAAGYSSHADSAGARSRRGLGLAITRSIVEAAGGRIYAEDGAPAGARFVLELPVRSG